jgi:hypothetical protein
MSPKAQQMKTGPSVPPKTNPGAQNMKTGPGTLGTAENEPGSTKLEKGGLTPSVPKISLRA